MFGSKLKTWMENYIGRAKKKEAQKEKPKGYEKGGLILKSSESLAQSDAGISSSSQQVLSSSATDNREGYSTTTIESERSGMIQTHTTISLPSPESAYSTGYSTDGASPGTTGPPEYYINIRTGKHYFPSPAPTPTSPQPKNHILQVSSGNQRLPDPFFPLRQTHISRIDRELSSSSSSSSCPKVRAQTFSKLSNDFNSQMDYFPREIRDSVIRQNTLSPATATATAAAATAPTQFQTHGYSKSTNKKSSSKSQLSSLKLFLKSPKSEREKQKGDINKTPTPTGSKKNLILSGKSRKWFKQPFQKFGYRRTDSSDDRGLDGEMKKETHFEKTFSYLLAQENSASPRQRNRIKTNPWLPTEPLSSQNFPSLSFSPMLTRNRSCSNTPLQNRRTNRSDSLQNPTFDLDSKFEESRDYLDSLEKAVSRHLCGNPVAESSDRSEEDLTLNEMMGTYNESYVYEKETDILSDSDPTDCEDYGTDSEANNGGDERDSHDDELDFIDNGSVIETEDNFPKNTGKCTYYDARNMKKSFLLKSDRHYGRKSSECRKNSRKDQDSKGRREKRRQSRKSFKREEVEIKVKGKMGKKIGNDESVEDSRRVFAHRVRANKGTKSAEGTPVTGRRQKTTKVLRESHIQNAKAGERKSEILVNLGDAEADLKYKELIEEAENILESMRKSPGNRITKKKSFFQRPDCDAVATETFKNSDTYGCSINEFKEQETPAKKSPRRDLGLKLSVETPKKLERLDDFEKKNKSSFKAKSSAHSPMDPLGPTLRNFAIFQPTPTEKRKISTSSSEGSENSKTLSGKRPDVRWGAVLSSSAVPFAFQSVDLGKPFTSYCPQSEPVKRKIYTCSKTYDKLLKRFENKSTVFEESLNGGVGRISLETNSPDINTRLNGNQGSPSRNRVRQYAKRAFFCSPHAQGPQTEIPKFPLSCKEDTAQRNAFISEEKEKGPCLHRKNDNKEPVNEII